VPPGGYWARIAHGKKITKPSLSAIGVGVPQSVDIPPRSPSRRTLFARSLRSSLQETKDDAAERIVVDEVLTKPHRLIVAAKRSLTQSQPDTYGRMTTRNGDVDIRVGPNSVPRALRVMDALLKAFDSKGFKLKFKEQYGLGSYVVIDGQAVQFSLDVASKRFDIPVSKQKENPWFLGPKVRYTPTELLPFRIRGDIFALDRPKLPLEKQSIERRRYAAMKQGLSGRG
jgi:hypothetical protein